MSWLRAGWVVLPTEPAVQDWVAAARPVALEAAADPAAHAQGLRHGGTWFAGVDALPNDATGAVAGGPPLSGAALSVATGSSGPLPLHRAQVSVTYPGYPQQDASESDAAFRYRRTRDAAHMDGLLPIGPERRRYLREPHAFILGLPLTDAAPGAAPLVVYEGSQDIMRAAFRDLFHGAAPEDWPQIDATEAYQAARRACFDSCRRVEVRARPGEAILVHRLALHGIAPWAEGAEAAPEGRAIAYFRPCFPEISDWLTAP
jgi:hypothetical protein